MVDPSGTYLYALTIWGELANQSQIYAASIGPDGNLTPVPGSPYQNDWSGTLTLTIPQ
jgi:hypothetical protein